MRTADDADAARAEASDRASGVAASTPAAEHERQRHRRDARRQADHRGGAGQRCKAITFRQKTMVGTARITINETDGEPFETIIVLGKGGMDITADSEAIGRLISLYLRTPSPISNMKKLGLVVEQLSGIGGAQPFGFGPEQSVVPARRAGQGAGALLAHQGRARASRRPAWRLNGRYANRDPGSRDAPGPHGRSGRGPRPGGNTGREPGSPRRRFGREPRSPRVQRQPGPRCGIRPGPAGAVAADECGLVPVLRHVLVHQSRRVLALPDLRPQHLLSGRTPPQRKAQRNRRPLGFIVFVDTVSAGAAAGGPRPVQTPVSPRMRWRRSRHGRREAAAPPRPPPGPVRSRRNNGRTLRSPRQNRSCRPNRPWRAPRG